MKFQLIFHVLWRLISTRSGRFLPILRSQFIGFTTLHIMYLQNNVQLKHLPGCVFFGRRRDSLDFSFFSSLSSFADFFPGFLLVGAASSGCFSSCPEEGLPSRLELLLLPLREVLLLGVVVELELFCCLSEVFHSGFFWNDFSLKLFPELKQ